jgi:hypothetical protein
MKYMKYKKEAATIVATSVCFFLFAYIIIFSVDTLVNIQTIFIKSVMLSTGISGVMDTLALLLPSFLAVIFLSLGFMVLVGYSISTKNRKIDSRKIGLASGLIGAIIIIFMFHFSITSFFIALSVALSAVYIIPLSRTYDEELKKWKLFRIGSNSSGKVLLLLNVFVAVGILAAIYSNTTYYENSFSDQFSSTLKELSLQQSMVLADTYTNTYRESAIAAIDKTYPNLPSAQQQALIAQIDQQISELKNNLAEEVNKKADETSRAAIQNLPLFKAYMTWLPILTAFTVFLVLEFMRSLVFCNIAGLFSALTIKIYGRK